MARVLRKQLAWKRFREDRLVTLDEATRSSNSAANKNKEGEVLRTVVELSYLRVRLS